MRVILRLVPIAILALSGCARQSALPVVPANAQPTAIRQSAATGSAGYSVIYRFRGGTADGNYPSAGVTAINGVLYGTTTYGGFHSGNCNGGCGTVFKL